jgi:thioredoxin reductase
MSKPIQPVDVAILGSGPAGMQAALVLSRTRKRIVVFDDPAPPRNGASHGVHNFLGLDGLLPAEIREVAWKQIGTYQSAVLLKERVLSVSRSEGGSFRLTGADGTEFEAARVVLAFGFQDVYPDVPGFAKCWGSTIIQCPFCDGYENRDRIWGIVPSSELQACRLPRMAQNWTRQIKVIVPPDMEIEPSCHVEFEALGITIHTGPIRRIHHTDGMVRAVTLDSGDRVEVGTLVWTPSETPVPLIESLVDDLGLAVDESGYIETDETMRTNVNGVWAAGDVQGSGGGLEAAFTGGTAASDIVRAWYQ